MTINSSAKYVLIDDHPLFRKGVKGFLEDNSAYECIGEFSETRHLLNSDRTLLPDFILLDINIPNLEGKMSCGLLKKKFTACKIIALTQYGNMEETLKSYQFDGYVQKDDTGGILEAIATVLAGGVHFEKGGRKRPHLSENMPEDDYLLADQFSDREREIICYGENGYSTAKIAELLHISKLTVRTHRRNFLRKLGKKKGPEVKEFIRKYICQTFNHAGKL